MFSIVRPTFVVVETFVVVKLLRYLRFTQEPKKCAEPDISLVYFLIFGSEFARKKNSLALSVYFPQTFSRP